MPRRARIVAAGYPMHVILRGIDRAPVFFAEDDDRFFLECLGTVAAEESVAVHAYVLMTNHVHLLMTAASEHGVAAVMKRLGQRYVQHINRTYRRTGGLLEGRARAPAQRDRRRGVRAARSAGLPLQLGGVWGVLCWKY